MTDSFRKGARHIAEQIRDILFSGWRSNSDGYYQVRAYDDPTEQLVRWIDLAMELRDALGHLNVHGRINESMPGHEYGYTDNCHYCPAIQRYDKVIEAFKRFEEE